MAEVFRERYEALEVIGRGGQGEVVRALDRLHGRQVALKVRAVASPTTREELLAEARILFGLSPHRGLPLVRDDFFVEDRYYLVMDWVEGIDLQQVVEARGDPGLGLSTVVGYLSQVADALDHLHGHEPAVIHGDVKPANLILTHHQRVVLVDFGIALQAGLGIKQKMATRGYAAPELTTGATPTPASDIYSLAATAFTLLTGAPPDGLSPDRGGLPRIGIRAAERAIRRGLSIDPARRPGTATEFVERLTASLQGEAPTGTVTFLATEVEESAALWEQHPAAMRESLARHDAILSDGIERYGGWLPNNPAGAEGVVAIFTRASDAMACALALQRALLSEPWPKRAALRVRMALHTGEAELREASYSGPALYRAIRLRDIAEGGQVVLSQATYDLVRDAAPEAVRFESLGSRSLRDLNRPEQAFVVRHAGAEDDASYTSDLATLSPSRAALDHGGSSSVATVQQVSASSDVEDGDHAPDAVSPGTGLDLEQRDDKTAARDGRSAVATKDLPSGEHEDRGEARGWGGKFRRTSLPTLAVVLVGLLVIGALAFALVSDDKDVPGRPRVAGQRFFASGGRDLLLVRNSAETAGDIYVKTVNGGTPRQLISTMADEFDAAWSHDGAQIAFVSRPNVDSPGDIYVMNADGSGVRQLTSTTGDEINPVWSPDGSQIAFEGASRDAHRGPYDIFVMNADGTDVRRLTAARADESHPSWSPDGRRILYLRAEATERAFDIYVMNPNGGGGRRITATIADEQGPSWSPDGTTIVFSRRDKPGSPGDIYVMNADGSGLRALTATEAAESSPSWSPDGTKISFLRAPKVDSPGDVYLIDADGTDVRRLDSTELRVVAVSW